MSDDLYQQAIMQRAKSPVRAGRLASPDASVTVDNPLCGDRITLDLKLEGGKIADVAHQVRGCALCQASASVMAAAVVGQSTAAVTSAQDKVKAMLGGGDIPPSPWEELGIFTPVRRHKSRHDCVVLPFDALAQAIAQAGKS
ncbi:MAG TPA: SUF system NifU family Fe-S cluster assembly protein [Alphaproteobacteria bacterium]